MKKRFVLSCILMLTFSVAFAQSGEILFVDFEPDSLVELKDHNHYPQQLLLIDLDNNGQPDLSVYQSSNSGGWWFYVDAFSDWEFVSFHIDAPIPPINEIVSWNTTLDWLPYFYQGQGIIDERFAIRHRVGDDFYYGWLRIYLIMNDTDWPWVALDKTAYCTVPNYPLLWGQTSFTGIGEEGTEPQAFATIHPNPTTGIVRIDGEKAIEIQVLNALGQLVKTIQNTNEVNLHGLPQGIYLLRVALEDGTVFTDKVVKE